ncbi:alanyl-tRNA editing protein [Thioclava sp.]|uniref:alanyl-tRNA editing protein n=1 Tax=Thioclava sp. TaxID=1933450 RepID=UPI003AA906D0
MRTQLENTRRTEALFQQDAYLRRATGTVLSHWANDGIILDQTIFYAEGGGQPGDQGHIEWDGLQVAVLNTTKGSEGTVALRIAPGVERPPIGTAINQEINWDRRYTHMRMHTALHLLTVVLPFPVTGGQVGSDKGRLDFSMPAPEESKPEMEMRLNELVERDLKVHAEWIKAAELDANPSLVKTLSVRPPTDQGRVRLVRISDGDATVDLQPCGGTHVSNTTEIGRITLGKIESKGRDNRRVTIRLF